MTQHSKKGLRRRKRSIEVYDGKHALDLATAQTYSENVFLFVPNLIGYTRIILAGLSLQFMSYHPRYCTILYGISCLLDAVDGHAARALGQSSKFGAVLDMVTDRSLVTGSKSHKIVSGDVSKILQFYYDPWKLFAICAGNEGFFVALYLMKWGFAPIGLKVGFHLPFQLDQWLEKLTWPGAMAIVTGPICALKNVINLVQLWKASKILVGVDIAERAAIREEQRQRRIRMRSRVLFNRHVLRCAHRVVLPSASRYPKGTRPVSSNSSPPSLPSPSPSPSLDPLPTDEHEEAKSSKSLKGRLKRTQERAENPQLPSNLNILWSSQTPHTPLLNALPPPELLQEALNNLLIAFHPQTQHRATYSTQNGLPVEPTLALYCPIEGGDYVIDETVRELARQTGAEVVVLDTVEIAAGEWGAFGKAATAVHLPENPLHLSSPTHIPSSPVSNSSRSVDDEEMAEDDDVVEPPHIIINASQPFSFSQLGIPTSRPARAGIVISRRTPPSKAKAFFDDIVNVPSPAAASNGEGTSSPPLRSPPRIIYIRDYPLLASTSSSWFSSLVASVRAHRQGPLSRPTSPIASPIMIVFGITPPIVPLKPSSSLGIPNGLFNLLMNRRSNSVFGRWSGKSMDLWDESEAAQLARERRLKDRLKNWESGDPSFYEELPESPAAVDRSTDSNAQPTAELVLSGPSGQSLGSGLIAASRVPPEIPTVNNRSFFRTSVIVPRSRITDLEKECRIARRRHLNELIMRMAIGEIGGILPESFEISSSIAEESPEPSMDSVNDSSSTAAVVRTDMWDSWGDRVESWTKVKEIADSAVGSVMGALILERTLDGHIINSSLDPTPVPWSAVYSAWSSHRHSRRRRKAWIDESSSKVEDDKIKAEEEETQIENDEIIERVKRDHTLDPHETRLLGCIVDPASMSTTFDQVHLPAHTIDSVRTLVSLPLLHPQAFAHGILKQHAMTGALLFGPPGTGKTLVVRALARESGARMLLIKPSDVMDMYVGEGEKLVRSVFSLARRLSPCVIFLDELDALFGARVSGRETGGMLAHRSVITEFMQEMDGLKTSRLSNVIVIGATNRPFDLDDAVLRRLPRRLLVDLPGENERYEILKILLRDETLSSELDLHDLAKRTESFSGSDLKHLCVAAALDAVKEGVVLPWNVPKQTVDANSVSGDTSSNNESVPPSSTLSRVLTKLHFTKALREITPSASESLGTLADLRKWNEEFGEGGKQRKRKMWGGRFGFLDPSSSAVRGEGRVDSSNSSG
ncbi:hypothetical protein Clacol_006336 [Clathrus columnatus]|uniref:AAA+ ATPase domain-containing protein n=1 Tax=Clathrus columnatus TaxID=1419009 RepID=A0AAV5AGS4_9AGAM|nr:hypothetical protein Clacol_006336 [Clathrus columnatus]